MQCISDTPLSDEVLLDVLEGNIDQATLKHLEECAYCQQQLDELGLFNERIQVVAHPEPQLLLDFQCGQTNEQEDQGVSSHLSTCIHCRELLTTYAAELSQPVRAYLTPIHATPFQSVRHAISQLQEQLIQLIQPTAQPRLALLGDDANDTITASSNGVSIFLNITIEGDRHIINGQVVADNDQNVWNEAVAVLSLDQTTSTVAVLNELGQFQHQVAQAGTYRLRIRAVTGQILLFENLSLS